ncbi:MAG: phosphoesterase [Firmicutes bacterium]|nr:phosphoesterase [Bacillota bacterium]
MHQGRQRGRRAAGMVLGVLLLLAAAADALLPRPRPWPREPAGPVPDFSHVFLIVLENHSPASLLHNPRAPYIRHLAATWGYEADDYGVTHPSLPNYIALLAGRTGGSHSDSPAQQFGFPTLAGQLDAHHLSWQAVMQGLPAPGYTGAWYPPPPAAPRYARKHDPFLAFPALARDRRRVVPLRVLARELRDGQVPRLVWITPDLCHDMHGQPPGRGRACPPSDPGRLVADGDRFLARWVPRILHSPAWRGQAVIFITWDESGRPSGLEGWRAYFAAGPGAPPLLPAWPPAGLIGGGRVPLIVIARGGPHPLVLDWPADHYAVLKTIEAGWHLGYLGHAASPAVPVLWPFWHGRPGRRP